MGKTVPKENIGSVVISVDSKKSSLEKLFRIASQVNVCKGFNVKSIPQRSRTLIMETWCSDNRVSECRARSPQCTLICPPAANCTICNKCSEARNNTKRSIKNETVPSDRTKKNETLMTREELIQKIHEEKRKRINLEKRERYSKIKEEMKEFEEADHKDFLTMFEGVKQEELSEEMLLFWEAQSDALKCKGPTGRRWHPK